MEPLGLNHIWVECLQPAPEGIEFAHAWAKVNGDDNLDDISTQSPSLYCTILSSPTWTTTEDLARWSQALFYEGRVLSEESLAEMLCASRKCISVQEVPSMASSAESTRRPITHDTSHCFSTAAPYFLKSL